MSGNRLLAAFAVLVALLGLTVWQWKARESEDDRPAEASVKLPKVEKDSVDGLDITAPGKTTVKLVKKDKAWRLTAPVDAPADQNAVDTALSKLSEMEVVGTAATKEENHKQLEVDDAQALHVVARQGSKMLIDLMIGTNRGGNTVLRQAGTIPVAAIKGPIKYALDKEVKDWRDRSIVDVQLDSVSDAVFQNENGRFHFVQEGGAWKQAAGEKPIPDFDGAQVKSILGAATNMSAMDFAGPEINADAVGVGATPKASVMFHGKSDKAGEQDVLLRIGLKKDASYYLMREGNEPIYLVSEFVGQRLQPTAAKFAKEAPAAAPGAPGAAGKKPAVVKALPVKPAIVKTK
jgi:hypothetical protein